ncbi:DUF4253 domain-containing protein [Saccharomonospora sp. NPDC046836]|uniref:DUF4253 domain-containing protein n=1 Tax=Saccharomonospora sp. NPDC046836 TaxID=3156921 RepID=UPI0033E37486
MTVVQFRSQQPIADLTLPPGRMHNNLWVSSEPISDASLYLACVAAYPRTGRWPVLIPSDPRFEMSGEDWIDDRGWLPPAGHEVDTVDVAATLADWWEPPCCEGTCLQPYDATFPGVARRAPRRADPFAEAGNTGSILAARGDSRLGIVETPRPADIPAVLGWRGTLNQTDQVAAVSAVLRSWEDRFGAVLISLGFDELQLSVAAPPKTKARALVVAAEHRAFCLADFSWHRGTLREFATELMGKRLWSFLWD